MLFAISKTKELPANCNLRNIHKQFGQRNHRRTAHSAADSEASAK